MFTGLIEDVGRVAGVAPRPQGRRIVIATGLDLAAVKLGDSIAVMGACLTVVSCDGDRFAADVSAETLRRTTLGDLGVGARVNLERALRVGDRLGGHLVQGHVDAVGELVARQRVGDGEELSFVLPPALLPTVVEKGSITLDGISLTVAALADPKVKVAVVPHTMAHTTLGGARVGAKVNVETDLIGKYVARQLAGDAAPAASGLTAARLAELGFGIG